MKQSFQFILFLIIVILSACNDDVRYDYGNFRMDFVTVLSPEEGIRFLRDDGIILLSETANDADNKYPPPGQSEMIYSGSLPNDSVCSFCETNVIFPSGMKVIDCIFADSSV